MLYASNLLALDMSQVDFGRYKRIVQGFFNQEPRNDELSGVAIWCLGNEYPSKRPLSDQSTPRESPEAGKKSSSEDGRESQDAWIYNITDQTGFFPPDSSDVERAWPSEFLDDCEARIWLTYRSGFPPIPKSPDASMTLSVRLRNIAEKQGFTSDTGWGCMIRSGQCLLANALSVLKMGRSWRRGIRQREEKHLLSLFADDPSAPFSIHRFVEHGAEACGKHPGEWFGPSATARCIKALTEAYVESGLRVYINGDGADVYENNVLRLATSSENSFTPTLILLGVRLGIDRVTPAYWEALKAIVELPQSIGIAGGRPSSSHYFFAHQREYFFYLDPHFTRTWIPWRPDPDEYTSEEVDSCHTRRLRRLSIEDMDPSMLLAFLIKDKQDWSRWRIAIESAPFKSVVHVTDAEPSLHRNATERYDTLGVETFDDNDDNGEILESASI